MKPIFRSWTRPTLKEVKTWAVTSTQRWFNKYLEGRNHYGPSFQGDPVLHALDEVRDLNSYLAYADSRTLYHIDLIKAGAFALKYSDPEHQQAMAELLSQEVEAFAERRLYHKSWDEPIDEDAYPNNQLRQIVEEEDEPTT